MVETVKNALEAHYPDDFSWCQECGRMNASEHHFWQGWNGGKTETIYTPKPEHTALPCHAQGGVMASLADCHGTGLESLALHRKNGYEPGEGPEPPRFVRASIDVDYLKPTPADTPLKAIGTPEEIHPKKWAIHIEVYAG